MDTPFIDSLLGNLVNIFRENPLPFLVVAGICVTVFILDLLFGGRKKRRTRPGRIDVTDPRTQLQAVKQVGFRATPVLNATERGVWAILSDALRDYPDLALMAQPNLGEIIQVDPATGSDVQRDAAFRSINSKRIDMGIFDREFRLRVAVEVQGGGHWQGNARGRDAVKREVFSRAGIPLLEIHDRDDKAAISARLADALRPPPAPRGAQRGRRADPPLTAPGRATRPVGEPPLSAGPRPR